MHWKRFPEVTGYTSPQPDYDGSLGIFLGCTYSRYELASIYEMILFTILYLVPG